MNDEADNFHKQPTHPKLTQSQEDLSFSKLPEKIGPYKIEALLDKGGMSYLYLGTHPETKEPITIKVLSQKYVSHPEVVQRFLNESEIISMTNHPNIITMHGHGEWEGGLYIAMEFVEGVSLRKYILQHPLSLKKALGMIIDIAYALCHLHTHGVIHRDLKPENILVTESGAIKVIDFGIAQLLTEKTEPDEPSKQMLIGTPIYISPEQKEDPENVSYPSDIYSLGIISYELILGKLSHGHIHLSLMPKGIQHILHKCLQLAPESRYQDIVDFIADVSAYLNSPTLEKDRVVGDHLSELSEELKQIQTTLLPSQPPSWPGIEMGIATHKGLKEGGVYYDQFHLSKAIYGVFLAETSTKGAEGYITMANIRGMVRALYPLTEKPAELITILNDLLLKDDLGPIFNLNYLVLKPKENVINYISCGYGNLWFIPANTNKAENITKQKKAIGVDEETQFEEATLSWNVGDILLLNTFAPCKAREEEEDEWLLDEAEFINAIHDNIKIPPQQLVDNILRKTRIAEREVIQDKAITLIGIKRVE